MAGRASAARAARRHLIATGVGFTAALAVAKAFIVPQSAESEGAESDQKRELKLVQVVFRCAWQAAGAQATLSTLCDLCV